MHELTICQSLLSKIAHIATPYTGCEVTEIVVAVGPLSGVEPQLLERAFSVAELDLDRASSIFAANALLCGTCGTWQVELRSGDEMLLKRVKLADVEESSATV